jgi:ribonuclease D
MPPLSRAAIIPQQARDHSARREPIKDTRTAEKNTMNEQATGSPWLVNGQRELDELAQALAVEPLIALDTEFVRESTYFPHLCLIQVATPSLAACVDCVLDLDPAPLTAALFRSDCSWVVHSGRQDFEVIWQAFGRLPTRLIDTQIAAALAGFTPQQGLQSLLAETLGVMLGKHFTRLDWSRRPLPADAIAYAIDDVRYLIPLWEHLAQRLAELGRLGWLEEDCAAQLTVHPETEIDAVWSRLKGTQALPAPARRAAYALVQWREATARRLNRPRRWILADALLLQLARSAPTTQDELAAVPEMPRKLVGRSGTEILAAIARRSDASLDGLANGVTDLERPDKEKVRALQARVRQHAQALGIHPEVLATRRDVVALTLGRPLEPPDGWRARELGRLLA